MSLALRQVHRLLSDRLWGGLLSLRAFRSYVFCLRAAKLSGAAPRYEPSGQRVYDAPPAVFLYIRARTRQRRKEAAP